MTKHNGKYYFQYGAPGTEFKVYADGVYVSDKPMGPFTYQKHNPMSYKPGGFVQGAVMVVLSRMRMAITGMWLLACFL